MCGMKLFLTRVVGTVLNRALFKVRRISSPAGFESGTAACTIASQRLIVIIKSTVIKRKTTIVSFSFRINWQWFIRNLEHLASNLVLSNLLVYLSVNIIQYTRGSCTQEQCLSYVHAGKVCLSQKLSKESLSKILCSLRTNYLSQKNVTKNLRQINFGNEISAAVFTRTKVSLQSCLAK